MKNRLAVMIFGILVFLVGGLIGLIGFVMGLSNVKTGITALPIGGGIAILGVLIIGVAKLMKWGE